jgi:hypothetical protein
VYPSAFALYLIAVNLSAGIGAAFISSAAAARLSASRWSPAALGRDVVAALSLMLLTVAVAALLAGVQSSIFTLDAWHFAAVAVTGVALRQIWGRFQSA